MDRYIERLMLIYKLYRQKSDAKVMNIENTTKLFGDHYFGCAFLGGGKKLKIPQNQYSIPSPDHRGTYCPTYDDYISILYLRQ